MNFWQKMKDKGKPILCLAPMSDVTDVAFRHIIAKYSKKVSKATLWGRGSSRVALDTYVTYTEFVSADGLVLAPEKGRKKLLKDLEYSEIERPIVAQFFTSKPEMMEKAAELAVELGFDGIDINMGCPDKSIEKQGAGASLIKNPKLARELIKAAKRGIQNYNGHHCNLKKCGIINKKEIPISVKTRLGYNKDELEEWLPELLAENPAVIVVHARTRKEMSKVPANWERIKRAVEIRDEVSKATFDTQKTLIIGNGDIKDVADAIQKCKESGADGAMLGRAVFGKPWLFSNSRALENKNDMKVIKKILQILLEHTKLFEKKLGPPAGGIKNFSIMKKHFKEYLRGVNLKDLKSKLMETENAQEVEELISKFSS